MKRALIVVAFFGLSACHHTHATTDDAGTNVGTDGSVEDASTTTADMRSTADGGAPDGGLATGDPTETIPGTGWFIAHDGLDGADVQAMGNSLASPSVVYASAIGGWIARSDDSGASWQMMHRFSNIGAGMVTAELSVDPDDAGHVVVTLTDAPTSLQVSHDGGKTWTQRALGSGYARPALGAALWVLGNASVARSTDDGATFQLATTPPGTGAFLYAHPENANVAYVTTGTGQSGSALRLFQTHDGGATWSDLSPSGATVTSFAMSQVDPLRVWVTLQDGSLDKSDDGGSTWSAVSGPFALSQCVTDLASKDDVVCYGNAQIASSTNAGATWQNQTFTVGLAPLARDASTWFAWGNHLDPQRTTDSGATWSLATSGFSAVHTRATALSDDGTIYVASRSGALYRSTDRGAHFARQGFLPSHAPIDAIAIDNTNHDIVYVTAETTQQTDFATWKSIDGGQTFSGLQVAASGPSGALVVFLASGPQLFAFDAEQRAFDSTNGGTTWTTRAMAYQPLSERTVPKTTTRQLIAPTDLSTDDGATWSSMVPPMNGHTILGSAVDAQTFYGLAKDSQQLVNVQKLDGSAWGGSSVGFNPTSSTIDLDFTVIGAANGADVLLFQGDFIDGNAGTYTPTLWTSIDGAQTWQTLTLPIDPTALELVPARLASDASTAVIAVPGDGVLVNATGVR